MAFGAGIDLPVLTQKIRIDSSDGEKGLARLSGAASTFGKVAAVGFAAGVAGLGAFGWKATNAASDLNESLSKTNAVFGESAAGLIEWSKTSAAAFGVSQQKALEITSTFGNLMTAQGLARGEAANLSRSMVELASDFASFNNLNPEDVHIKMRAALVGEYEPMRDLGVAMSAATVEAKAHALGFREVNGKYTEAALIQARYALIMEQSKNAQGDFDKTASGLANTQRILAAQFQDLQSNIGQAFLPVIGAAANLLSKVVLPAFNSWAVAAGPKIQAGINATTRAVSTLGKAFGWFRRGDTQGFAELFDNAFGNSGRLVAPARAIADAIRKIGDAIGALADSDTQGFGEVMDNLFGNSGRWVGTFRVLGDLILSVDDILKAFGRAIADTTRWMVEHKEIVIAVAAALGGLKAFDVLSGQVLAFGESLTSAASSGRAFLDVLNPMAGQSGELIGKIGDLGRKLGSGFETAQLKALYLGDELAKLKSKTVSVAVDISDTAVAKVKELADAMNGLVSKRVKAGVDVDAGDVAKLGGLAGLQGMFAGIGGTIGAGFGGTIVAAAAAVIANPIAWVVIAVAAAGLLIYTFRDEIAKALPVVWEAIQTFFAELPGRIAGFLTELPGLIGKGLGALAGVLVLALAGIVALIWQTLTNWGPAFIGWLFELGAKAVGAIADAAVSLASEFAAGIESMWETIGEWGGKIIGWFAELPGKIVDALAEFGTKFAEFFGEQFTKLGEFFDTSFTLFKEKGVKAIPEILGNLVTLVTGFFSGLAETVLSALTGLLGNILGWGAELIGMIAGFLASIVEAVWNWPLVQTVVDVFANIIGAIGWAISQIWQGIQAGWEFVNRITGGKLDEVLGTVKRIFTNVKDWITETVTSIKDKVVEAWQGIVDGASRVFGGLKDAVKTGLKTAVDLINTVLSGVNKVAGFFGIESNLHINLGEGDTKHEGGVIGDRRNSRRRTPGVRERLLLAEEGEGILPVSTMRKLTPEQFERLRRGDTAGIIGETADRLGGTPGRPPYTGDNIFDRGFNAAKNTFGDALSAARKAIANILKPAVQAATNGAAGIAETLGGTDGFGGTVGNMIRRLGDWALDWAAGADKNLGMRDLGASVAELLEQYVGLGGSDILRAGAGRDGSWKAILAFLEQAGVPYRATSTFRPGARTRASGSTSYHARNRAVDLVGPDMMRIWSALFAGGQGILRELIYSAAPSYIGGGRVSPISRLNPITKADHWDHVHAALGAGGLVTRPMLAALAEKGVPEFVLPLDQAADTLARPLGDALDMLGIPPGGGGSSVTVAAGAVEVHVTVNGDQDPGAVATLVRATVDDAFFELIADMQQR